MGQERQPLFVVLEGLDGAGTTTQAKLLADALQARDLQVCLTTEPSDGPLGRVLRAHVQHELTLSTPAAALAFAADRADHLEQVIRPAIARGCWVVCDRYLLSTLAYQGAGGADRAWILDVSQGIDVPDICIYLDLPEEDRRGRVGRRASLDRYEDPSIQEKLRQSYSVSIELLRARGHRIEWVDSSGSREQTHKAILTLVDSL